MVATGRHFVYGRRVMPLTAEALGVLRRTSRTFFIPIVRLPGRVRDAVGSAYLCMRSIDEIEDHPRLNDGDKIRLLHEIGEIFSEGAKAGKLDQDALQSLFEPYGDRLPGVTLALGRFAGMAPATIAGCVWSAVSGMAHQMAHWVQCGFAILTEADLDEYTYDVAGRVGELLTDIWRWYDGTESSAEYAVGFGRGLQAVNIIRNRQEDLHRGVDFWPPEWTLNDLHTYAQRQLRLADAYMNELPAGPVREFCRIPLMLATASLEAIMAGQPKLTRERVIELVGPGEGAELLSS